MKKMVFAATSLAVLLIASAAQAQVIEDFETGAFGPNWVQGSAGVGAVVISGAGAHDGAFGVSNGAEVWMYRTDAAANLGSGSTLSAWTRFEGSGRFYLGFGADATGANSFVLGANTNEIIFQNNEGYLFSNAVTQGFSFQTDTWYLAKVTFGPSILGEVFASDGTTLLASLNASGLTRGATGGIAVRGFAGANYDTISVGAIGGIPEPTTWAMMIGGFGAIGGAMRRRSVKVAYA